MVQSIAGHLGQGDFRPDALQAMLGSVFRRTRGPHLEWRSDRELPVAFGHGGAAAHPNSATEQQPIQDPASGCVCVADIRLDNRELLRTQLGAARSAGDCELALGAYLRWGLSFGAHLLGAFAIAIWDPGRSQLVLCRDHIGVRSLIYTADASSCVFGSAVAPVLDASPKNHPAQVERLQNMLVQLEEIEVTTTAFRDVLRVPAASCVTWRPTVGATVHDPFWIAEEQEQLQLGSDQEYGEALAEVFGEAVRCRMTATTPPAINLSGGIDSSAIIAAACAQSSDPVRTYSAVGEGDDDWPGSDMPYIRRLIPRVNVDAVLMTPSDLSGLHHIGPILDDPDGFFDVGQGVQGATAKLMSERGDGVLLSGVGGDEVFYAHPVEVALEHGSNRDMRRALGELTTYDGMPLDAREWMRPLARRLLPSSFPRRRQPDQSQLRERMESVGLDPTGAAWLRLQERNQALRTNPAWTTTNSRLNRVRRRFIMVALERYDRLGARHGIDVRHPFLDVRVIEFALSLPASQLRRGGWSKWILRNGTAVDLPASIAMRPKSNSGMSEFWDAATRAWWPPGNICVETPDPRLFAKLDANPSTDLDYHHFLRHMAASWWITHGT